MPTLALTPRDPSRERSPPLGLLCMATGGCVDLAIAPPDQFAKLCTTAGLLSTLHLHLLSWPLMFTGMLLGCCVSTLQQRGLTLPQRAASILALLHSVAWMSLGMLLCALYLPELNAAAASRWLVELPCMCTAMWLAGTCGNTLERSVIKAVRTRTGHA